MTAEELRQRLDGAKERMLSQPRTEQRSQATNSGEQQGGSGEGEERAAGGRQGAGKEETCLLLPFKIWRSLVITPNNTMQQHNDSGLDLDNCITVNCFYFEFCATEF